jgi:hypothetical protein
MSLEILGALAPAPFVVIPAGRKAPVTADWPHKGISLAELNRRLANNPRINVGLILGPTSGVVDLDCDGPQAEQSLRKLFDGEPPATLSFASKRGRHLFFKYDPRFAELPAAFKSPDYPDLEFRLGGSAAAQSVIPPSTVDGVSREWLNSCEVAEWS